MPQLRKVPSFQSLCLRNVGYTVEKMAKDIATNVHVDEDLQKTCDYLNELMKYVPHCLYDHIATQVLEAVRRVVQETSPSITKLNILGRINEIVLNPQLKCLRISEWPNTVMNNFYPNMQKLTGLEKLELGYFLEEVITAEFYEYLSESISAMEKLKSFTFQYSCTDAIVKTIGNHCRDIEYLDLGWSYLVTDQIIPHLLKCSNLKTLSIVDTKITVDGMTQIIVGLPNLLEVNYDHFGLVSQSLKNIGSGPFGLRKAQPIFWEDLNFFPRMFPKIEYIELTGSISGLPILASLENLNTLVVRMSGNYGDYLKELLQVRGCNITSLFLDRAEGVDFRHIIDIGLYCPNLKCLGLMYCEFTDSGMPSGRIEVPLFKNLQKVYWVQYEGIKILEFLLSHAFNIQVIDVTYYPLSPPHITHSFVENVLTANPMRNLEEFSVSDSPDLNMRTVEILLESCANLKVLSSLDKWRGIREDELKTFKEYIASHNFDLKYESSPRPSEITE